MAKRTQDRAKQILHLLLKNGSCSVEELAAKVGISAASIRRSLSALELQGVVHRTHGGAEIAGKMTYEAFRFDAAFPEREGRFSEEKRRIALASTEFVLEGDTVMLAPGTTVTQLARTLRYRTGIRVVTSALNIGMELSGVPHLELTITGGSVRWPGAFSMVGPTTYEAINQFFFDIAFLGVCGVHSDRGVTVIEPEEAFILRVIIQRSKRVIVVADSSKIGVYSTASVCNLNEIDTLITDNGLDPQLAAELQQKIPELIMV